MGPTAFRDGIFSSSDPMSRYGMLVTSFSDGSLGDNLLKRPELKTESDPYGDGCYADCIRKGATTAHCNATCYPSSGPNYKLWGLVAAGVIGLGALGYMLAKK